MKRCLQTEEGVILSASTINRAVRGVTTNKGNELQSKIVAIPKRSWLESRLKDYIRNNFSLSDKVYPVSEEIYNLIQP